MSSKPNNLVDLFLSRSVQCPEGVALRVKSCGVYQDISWEYFSRAVRHFALGLYSEGVKHGSCVGLLSENRPEWAYTDLAILSLGAVTVPIYPTSSVQDISYILNHSEVSVLVVSTREQYERISSISHQCEHLKLIVLLDEDCAEDAQVKTFAEVCAHGEKEEKSNSSLYESLTQKISVSDLATIIYTSGTTGEPKGVMLSHANILSNVMACTEILPASSEDCSLSFLPLSHVFERMAGHYFFMHQGVTIAYAENMNTVPENLLEIQPTIVTSVPRLYEKIQSKILDQVSKAPVLRQKLFHWAMAVGRKSSPYRRTGAKLPLSLKLQYAIASVLVFKKIKARLGGKLRYFISGGAPLPKDVGEFFYAADILILEGYGLTETSPVISVNRPDKFLFGSVGPLIPGVEVRIAEDGEILTRGPHVMLGYFKKPVETAEVMRGDWLVTGDIGWIDQDGLLKITDRKKEIIVTSGGKNVAPQKIENLLKCDEYISQVCVMGDKRRYLTALVVPLWERLEPIAREKGIVFESCAELCENTVMQEFMMQRIDALSASLAKYEALKYVKLLAKEFSLENGELTPTLKMKRRVIAERYANLIEEMYV